MTSLFICIVVFSIYVYSLFIVFERKRPQPVVFLPLPPRANKHFLCEMLFKIKHDLNYSESSYHFSLYFLLKVLSTLGSSKISLKMSSWRTPFPFCMLRLPWLQRGKGQLILLLHSLDGPIFFALGTFDTFIFLPHFLSALQTKDASYQFLGASSLWR